MKKITLLSMFMVLFVSFTMAQNVPGAKMTPQVVKDKFKAEYPNAVLKRWEVKTAAKEYVAVFTDQNLNKRARYKADGTPVLLHVYHPAAAVPSAVSAKILAEFPGFKVDWANEWKNFRNGNHFFEVRLSKPGYVLKVMVKPDGTIITDNKSTEGTDEGADAPEGK